MQTAIISTALAIVLFLCSYLGFRTGLRLGMDAAKGIKPEPLRNPVQVVNDIKTQIETSKEIKKEMEELRKFFDYNGDPPKEGE